MDDELLGMVKRMCEIVLGNNFGNSELDGLALHVGHDPDVLNSATETGCDQQPTTGSSTPCEHVFAERYVCLKCGGIATATFD